MRKIPIAEAVGLTLCHDITQIIPGQVKRRAFKRGHVIRAEDIPVLLNLGKEHIYFWENSEELVHEDEAALILAKAAAGQGLTITEPNQGKVNLVADIDGLLKVRVESLNLINDIDGIILASLHNNRVIQRGTTVAGTRIIPLAIESEKLTRAERICAGDGPLLSIKPFRPLRVGIVTTGNEVYQGRIKDGFCSVISQKIKDFGASLIRQVIVPDDPDMISDEIMQLIADGAELVLVTGGMSVDPDDSTPTGIRRSGAQVVFYGVPVLPGSMLMLAYHGDIPVCGIPGCVMFNGITSFDLILPHLLAGERLNRSWAVSLGHGGLCEECPECHYPVCAFGKSS
ncbi:MAG: molybdopterin-binding protein [Bacillota bacterium]